MHYTNFLVKKTFAVLGSLFFVSCISLFGIFLGALPIKAHLIYSELETIGWTTIADVKDVYFDPPSSRKRSSGYKYGDEANRYSGALYNAEVHFVTSAVHGGQELEATVQVRKFMLEEVKQTKRVEVVYNPRKLTEVEAKHNIEYMVFWPYYVIFCLSLIVVVTIFVKHTLPLMLVTWDGKPVKV